MNKSSLRIGLLGPFGFGNLGDAAIQEAAIYNIRERIPDSVIVGYSLNPSDTEERHGIRAFPIKNTYSFGLSTGGDRNPTRYGFLASAGRKASKIPSELKFTLASYRSLDEIDWLVISGGGQLDDYWGGPWQHPFRLFKWTAMARRRGIKVLFLSVGAGSINSPLSKIFVKSALKTAVYRSYRDEYTIGYLRQMGISRKEDSVIPDLAYSHPLEGFNEAERSSSPQDNLVDVFPTIGIGPMAYFDPRAWPEKNQQIYARYLDQLAGFVEWLISRQYRVVLFPGGAVADRRAIQDLMHNLDHRQAGSSGKVDDPVIESVDDLLKTIRRTDLVVATRLHSVILAHLCTKPVLALSYHEKVSAVMDDMGQSEYCLDVQTIDTEKLIQSFQKLEGSRNLLASQIKDRIGAHRRVLGAQYDAVFSTG